MKCNDVWSSRFPEAIMKIQLLEIGSETEQLSACRLSLLLGIAKPQNQISTYLKLARQLLAVDHAVL